MSIEEFLKEKAPIIDKMIEKYIPRKFDENALVFQLERPRYEYNLKALNKAVAEPIWEFLGRGGKRWRPSLFLLVCEALGKNWKDFLDFAIIPEVIHNGTLMIDDVEDLSELRRGKPCTYKLFGLDIAINAGNAMYYLPLLPLIQSKNRLSAEKVNKIYEIYVKEMIHLSFGQAADIAWHKGLADADEISEAQYFQMCAYKSGTIPRLSAKIAATLSDANHTLVEKLGRFAEAVSVAFQIHDDILDLVGEKFAEKKGGCGQDVTEGKRTLIVIQTLKQANPKDKERLVEILNMHTTDQKLRDEAINLMKKYGAIEYAKRSAQALVKESWKEVDKLLSPSKAKEKLKAFSTYLVERKI
ncbi:MAG: polyprenyl synthetase family protein [Thermoproteota archaeon]|nr:polyprenyl synthetase family protein [Thermoproteota archaeon]